jgi:hypothetical protein
MRRRGRDAGGSGDRTLFLVALALTLAIIAVIAASALDVVALR